MFPMTNSFGGQSQDMNGVARPKLGEDRRHEDRMNEIKSFVMNERFQRFCLPMNKAQMNYNNEDEIWDGDGDTSHDMIVHVKASSDLTSENSPKQQLAKQWWHVKWTEVFGEKKGESSPFP